MPPPRSRLSIVIPIHNQAPFVTQALESVWAQDLSPDEIIVVDDGSTDDTPSVLDTLAQRGPFHLIRQSQRGRSAVRNRAIQESTGELIAFLDADDYWLPGKVRAQYQALDASRSDFSYSGNILFGEGKAPKSRPLPPSPNLLNDLIWLNRFATTTVVVKRSLLDQTGLFDETLSLGEDWSLWLRLAACGRAACVPEPLVGVRRHPLGRRRYSLQTRESSIRRVLSQFFQFIGADARHAHITLKANQIWSWHYSRLTKLAVADLAPSYSARFTAQTIRHHPNGLRYLLPYSKP